MSKDTAILKTTFDTLVADASPIEFDTNWNNGTGYFNGAQKVKLALDEHRTSVCPKTKRTLLLIGTKYGTAVLFERYTPSDDNAFVLVGNIPQELKLELNLSGAFNLTQLAELAGIEVNVTEVEETPEETIIENTEEETMSNTTETKTNRFTKALNVAKRSGKYVAYAAGGLAVAGGAYAAYAALKGMGADAAAEAVGEAAGAAVNTAGEAVVETVAAWR